MSAVLAREVFTTSRLAEFCSRQQLVTATGCAIEDWPLYVVKELIDNALDDCEEHGIAPAVRVEIAADHITVADNGSGLPAEVLNRILNYSTRTSAREAYVSPTRGAQGNALQTILALPFALDDEAGRVTIEAHSEAHEIEFSIDQIHQTPAISRATTPSLVQNGTQITVWWPERASSILSDSGWQIVQIATTFAALNPHLGITLTIDDEEEINVTASDAGWVKWKPSDPTSPHWYDAERLKRLIAAYVANGKGTRTVREFIAEFSGLARTAKQKIILDQTELARATLRSLCPENRFDDHLISQLLTSMHAASKEIKPDSLGVIGRDHWKYVASLYGGDLETFAYHKSLGVSDGLPWLVEAAFCWRPDAGGRVIARGVNFTPSLRDPFQRLGASSFAISLDSLLSARWSGTGEPIAILVHFACPRIAVTDRGKGAVVVPPEIGNEIIDAVKAVTAKWEKQRTREIRDRAARHNRETALAKRYESKLTIKEAARQVMAGAYAKASGGFPAKARQIMYAARPAILSLTGKNSFDDAYFTQTLLPNYIEEHPDETADWDVVFDARGHFTEPHTGLSVPLGTLEVRRYLGERPWLRNELRVSSSDSYTTIGPESRFRNVLFIEKEGFDSLLESGRIAERYDIATMSTKGMSVTAARHLLDELTSRDVKTVFVLHDFDVSGFGIGGTLGTNSRRYKFSNQIKIVDLGLRLVDVETLALESEPAEISGDIDKRKETLRRHGATADEIEFLLGPEPRRVELNAMTSPQFIEFIKTKLDEHGITKLIPSTEILEAHWRRLYAEHKARDAFEEIREKCEADAKTAVQPANLAEKVADALRHHPTLPWDLALARHVPLGDEEGAP